ncbi:hypothetical protein M8C13_25580 [Crossiella sp. SN42]|uniref:hypothetical protein n=1 Tax=Crossiella sp. SN42 TaxID=2944808 RepID=UPI00207D3293|nr:hypothetical protein [Crossiella sp. SN42]MCO1579126.1 hypothetical protein [Crossiella sp. SN42]
MSFFDEPGVRASGFMWAPPVDRVVPAVWPVTDVVFRGPRTLIAVESVRCWPDGLSLAVTVLTRDREPPESLVPHPRDPAPVTPGLDLGLRYADGRKATTLDRLNPVRTRAFTDDLALYPSAATRGPRHLRQTVDVRPLPPAGPVLFVVRWPANGLPESSATLPGDQLHALAQRAVELGD